MCIIIHKPVGITLEKSLLRECWVRNSDGAGFMFFDQEQGIMVYRTIQSFKAFYRALPEQAAHEIVMHFRIGTHGDRSSLDNCHPFYLEKHQMCYCHNGIIHHLPKDTEKSDTRMFGEMILEHLPPGFLSNPGIMELMREYIGHSKLAFMDNKGVVTVVNKSNGVEDLGCWFSNGSYKPAPRYETTYVPPYAPSSVGGPPYRAWSGWDDDPDSPPARLERCPVCKINEVNYYGQWCDTCLTEIGNAAQKKRNEKPLSEKEAIQQNMRLIDGY